MELIPNSFVEVINKETNEVRKNNNTKGKFNSTGKRVH